MCLYQSLFVLGFGSNTLLEVLLGLQLLSKIRYFLLFLAHFLSRVILVVDEGLIQDLLPPDSLVMNLLYHHALLDLVCTSLQPLLQTQVLGLYLVLKG